MQIIKKAIIKLSLVIPFSIISLHLSFSLWERMGLAPEKAGVRGHNSPYSPLIKGDARGFV
jgi:hypothetical protein